MARVGNKSLVLFLCSLIFAYIVLKCYISLSINTSLYKPGISGQDNKDNIKIRETYVTYKDFASIETVRNLEEKNSISYLNGTFNFTTFDNLCPRRKMVNYVKLDSSSSAYKYKEEMEGLFKSAPMCTCPDTYEFEGTEQRLPDAIIIGVDKAGTTALRFFLNDHPDIVFPQLCEMQFFNSKRYTAWGWDWYRQNMGFARPDQVVMEKSPMYYRKSSVSAQRIHAMNSKIKILVVVGDPVRRTISDYVQRRNWTPDSKRESFQSLILNSSGEINTRFAELQVSVYYKHIKIWFEAFPRDQILVVDGDLFASDLPKEMERVENFLGVRRHITTENTIFVQNKGPSGFFCLKVDLPDALAKCLNSGKGKIHPNVTDEIRQKMKQFFAPYNEQLYDLVGKEFCWNKDLS